MITDAFFIKEGLSNQSRGRLIKLKSAFVKANIILY
jgi:hypothetical protein